jgi:hypothetical protein
MVSERDQIAIEEIEAMKIEEAVDAVCEAYALHAQYIECISVDDYAEEYITESGISLECCVGAYVAKVKAVIAADVSIDQKKGRVASYRAEVERLVALDALRVHDPLDYEFDKDRSKMEERLLLARANEAAAIEALRLAEAAASA